VARDVESPPLAIRNGVLVRGGCGLGALFAVGMIAGEAGLSGLLSIIVTSFICSVARLVDVPILGPGVDEE